MTSSSTTLQINNGTRANEHVSSRLSTEAQAELGSAFENSLVKPDNLEVPDNRKLVTDLSEAHQEENTGNALSEQPLNLSKKILNKLEASSLPVYLKKTLELGLRTLDVYSKNNLGNGINNLEVPRWSKSFLSMISHITPMLATIMLLKPVHVPAQLKSALGLTAMYLGVWGDEKLKDLPKIAAITSVTSLTAEAAHLPHFLKRSLLGLAVTAMQHLTNDNKLQDFSSDKALGLLKNFMSKLLQTELKLNTALPLGSFLADKVENPLFKMGVKVFSISALVTALSETFRAVGLQPNSNLNDANTLSSGCPLCGSVNVGECISSDIGPAASMGDDLTKKIGLV
ncbi:MAG: hypothetical protein ACKO3R_11090 [bacterium]